MTRNYDVDEIPEGELGVALDETVDALIAARGAKESIDEMYVALDTIADSHDLPGFAVAEIRKMQEQAAEARRALGYEIETIEERQAAISERLAE